jgi:hypothetical protein
MATGAAIAALWPGGEGPKEAFSRVYNEQMSKPAGLTSVSGGASNADVIATGAAIVDGNRNWENASDEAEEERLKTGEAGNNVAIDGSTTINQQGQKVYLSDPEPTDRFGSRIGSWWSGED